MLTPIQIIEKLNSYVFHDMPVASIEFSTDTSTKFVLNLLLCNEINNDYEKLKLTFQGIQNLETDPIILTPHSDLEVYSFNYSFDSIFHCDMMLLIGIGEPSLSIKLSCDAVEINN